MTCGEAKLSSYDWNFAGARVESSELWLVCWVCEVCIGSQALLDMVGPSLAKAGVQCGYQEHMPQVDEFIETFLKSAPFGR